MEERLGKCEFMTWTAPLPAFSIKTIPGIPHSWMVLRSRFCICCDVATFNLCLQDNLNESVSPIVAHGKMNSIEVMAVTKGPCVVMKLNPWPTR
jgi:hypothetical protein